MAELSELFKIVISNKHMVAELDYTDVYLVNRDAEITEEAIINYLRENNIVYGIHEDNIQQLQTGLSLGDFPIMIAKGKEPAPGIDGKIHYVINFNPKVEKTDSWNFREVMRIPSVDEDDKLATITLPTEGEEGTNVHGETVQAKPGQPVKIKAGKNVRFDEESLAFYSTSVGQANIQGESIHVHPVFEVTDTLSMKEGNLDFIGTIIIRGDVPSGYTLTAGGDVKIFGIVEAASIHAKGSVYISEGLAGLQKGSIDADESIQIGYVNQGIIHAGTNLYVENSIIHSECMAGNELICQRGSIIGGKVSAGSSIQVKHVGNYLSTKTELILGKKHREIEHIEELQLKKKEIEETLSKLTIIGDKLSQNPNVTSDPKLLLTLKKQKVSYSQNKQLLDAINEKLQAKDMESNEKKAKLTITGNLFENTIITFGKYKRIINSPYKQVELELLQNEIYMRAL